MSYKTTRYSTHLGKPVGPGIDISHYGAPFRGMLGLGGLGEYVERPGFHAEEAAAGIGLYTESPGFDYEYATAGLGAYAEMPGFDNAEYATAGMGEMLYRYDGLGYTGAPAADPRMLKQYSKVKLSYHTVRGCAGDAASRCADKIFEAVRAAFPGNTVGKVGGSGWVAGRRVAIEVTFAQPVRLGEVKQKAKQVEHSNPLSSIGGDVDQAKTAYNASDLMSATEQAVHTSGGAVTPSDSTSPAGSGEPAGGGMSTTMLYAGLGVGALVVVGGLALALRPKAKAVVANRRRRRRRSSRRSSRRRSSRRRR